MIAASGAATHRSVVRSAIVGYYAAAAYVERQHQRLPRVSGRPGSLELDMPPRSAALVTL